MRGVQHEETKSAEHGSMYLREGARVTEGKSGIFREGKEVNKGDTGGGRRSVALGTAFEVRNVAAGIMRRFDVGLLSGPAWSQILIE
jgi:hypothetical protein